MKPIRAIAVLLLSGFSMSAASMDEFKRDCDAFKSSPGVKPFFSCASDFFTLQPLHPIIRSIVPGGGTGIGANYTLDSPKGQWHRIFTVDGAISLRNFWVAESVLTLRHPKFGEWNTARPGDAFATHFYLRARGLPRMPFYGIGPNTSRASLVDFSERDVFIGGDVVNPVSSWLRVGGMLEGIVPDVSGFSSSSVRSIDRYFNETTAPGLFRQPKFVHSEVSITPHHAYPLEFNYHIGYNFFNDMDSGHYSFQRFRADLRHNIYLSRASAQPKRDAGVLQIRGLLSMSSKSANSAIPFYLQETLGGSDINGDPALRGFADYRFRAPNLMVIQTQYERRVKGYFGVLAFYDTGEVTTRKGDLSLANMRHSYGFGVNVWVESKIVFRAYVGLGSGEGYHTFVGLVPGVQ
jgi:hypothetical protein